jgi:cyanophycinase-like exopeptidase
MDNNFALGAFFTTFLIELGKASAAPPLPFDKRKLLQAGGTKQRPTDRKFLLAMGAKEGVEKAQQCVCYPL